MAQLNQKTTAVALALADCFGDDIVAEAERLAFGRDILRTCMKEVRYGARRTAYDLLEAENILSSGDNSKWERFSNEKLLALILVEWLSRNIQQEEQGKNYTVEEAVAFLNTNGYVAKVQQISDVYRKVDPINEGKYRSLGSNTFRAARWLWDIMQLEDICKLLDMEQAKEITHLRSAFAAVNVRKVYDDLDAEAAAAAVMADREEAIDKVISLIEDIEPQNVSYVYDVGQIATAYALNATVRNQAICYFNKTVAMIYAKGRAENRYPYANTKTPPPSTEVSEACYQWSSLPEHMEYIDGLKEILLKRGLREDYNALKQNVPVEDIIAGL